MKVRVQKTSDTDRLIVVKTSSLLNHLATSDIDCRDSSIILDAYHRDWFYEIRRYKYFIPPAAYLQRGILYFIAGRHRTVLLCRHLSEFPFLIGNLGSDHIGREPSPESIAVIEDIKVRDFLEDGLFALPDLKFGDFEPS